VKIGIVASRFNEFIVEQLLEGALDALKKKGIDDRDIVIAWVPGAFELPLAAEKMAQTGKIDAVISLGTVIRGGTPHFDYVAGECARGIREASQRHGIPVAFGVLTTDTGLERATRASMPQWRQLIPQLRWSRWRPTLAPSIQDDQAAAGSGAAAGAAASPAGRLPMAGQKPG
jgi:6,7-dimethyl-8-ribityllumazine synthase